MNKGEMASGLDENIVICMYFHPVRYIYIYLCAQFELPLPCSSSKMYLKFYLSFPGNRL